SVIERHEILRTTFPADANGRPYQNVASTLQIELGLTDLSHIAESDRERETKRCMLEFTHRPFDLAHGPLVRGDIFCFSPLEHVLALDMHHIVSDGWSGGVLFQELGHFYEANVSGQAPALEELPIQYADYAIWQREWMQGEVLENELAFWQQQLEGAQSTLELPTDWLRPERLGYQGGTGSVRLGRALSDQLKALCRSQGSTLFPALLTALNILLARWSGQKDMVVGTISANRDQTEIEKLIGCFMNFLPLRTQLAGEPTVLDCLRHAKQHW